MEQQRQRPRESTLRTTKMVDVEWPKNENMENDCGSESAIGTDSEAECTEFIAKWDRERAIAFQTAI